MITHFYEHSSLCVVLGYAIYICIYIYNVGVFCVRMDYRASK